MTQDDQQAKEQLSELLERYTAGSVLHLLSDLYRDLADDARKADDAVAYRQFKLVEHTLFVVGMGIDSANPS